MSSRGRFRLFGPRAAPPRTHFRTLFPTFGPKGPNDPVAGPGNPNLWDFGVEKGDPNGPLWITDKLPPIDKDYLHFLILQK